MKISLGNIRYNDQLNSFCRASQNLYCVSACCEYQMGALAQLCCSQLSDSFPSLSALRTPETVPRGQSTPRWILCSLCVCCCSRRAPAGVPVAPTTLQRPRFTSAEPPPSVPLHLRFPVLLALWDFYHQLRAIGLRELVKQQVPAL